MKERNIWDRGRWRFVKEIKFDFMTRYIYEHISKYVSFNEFAKVVEEVIA